MGDSLPSAILSVLFSKVSILLISVGFVPILVRLLGPARYGRYAVVLSVFAVVSIFMSYGTIEALRKYVSERPDEPWRAAVLTYVSRPALGLALVGAAGFVVAARSGLVARAFGDAYTSLFYLLAAYAIGQQLRDHVLWTLKGLKLESRSEPLKVAHKATFASLALTLVYFGYGVEGVLVADVVASTSVAAIGFAYVRREIPSRSLLSTPDVELPRREIVHYSVGTVFFFLFLTSLYHVDVLLLQHWAADEVVGYYQGALAIVEVLWIVPFAVQFALLQRVSELWAAGDLDAIERRAQLVTHHAFLVTALLALGMAVLASDFVVLYLGAEFAASVTPLLLLLPGVLGFAIARPSLAVNQGRRSLRPLIAATAGSSFVNLALNLALIPRYGMVGAAISTSIGYGSLAVFQSMAGRRLGYRPLAGIRWGPTVVTVAATALVVVPVSALVPSTLLALAVVPPIGAIVYGATALSTGAVTPDEVETFVAGADVVPPRIRRRLLVAVRRIPRVYG